MSTTGGGGGGEGQDEGQDNNNYHHHSHAQHAHNDDKNNEHNDNNDDNNNSDDKEDDPQMSRLLHRLQQEYSTNFGSSSSSSGDVRTTAGGDQVIDVARARYLLEASAGNLGLASMMYWEDYLLANHHHHQNDNVNNNNELQQQQQQQQFASPRGGGGGEGLDLYQLETPPLRQLGLGGGGGGGEGLDPYDQPTPPLWQLLQQHQGGASAEDRRGRQGGGQGKGGGGEGQNDNVAAAAAAAVAANNNLDEDDDNDVDDDDAGSTTAVAGGMEIRHRTQQQRQRQKLQDIADAMKDAAAAFGKKYPVHKVPSGKKKRKSRHDNNSSSNDSDNGDHHDDDDDHYRGDNNNSAAAARKKYKPSSNSTSSSAASAAAHNADDNIEFRSAAAAARSNSNNNDNHILSSMHNFQRQLDGGANNNSIRLDNERLSSMLDERLSSYQSRLLLGIGGEDVTGGMMGQGGGLFDNNNNESSSATSRAAMAANVELLQQQLSTLRSRQSVLVAAAAAGRGGGASSSSSCGSSLVPGGGTNNDNVAIRASISSAMHAAQRCQQPVAAAAAGSRNNHDSPGEWERFLDQYGSRGLNNLYGRGSLGGGGGGNGAGPLPFDWFSRTMAYNQARDADVGVGCAGGSGGSGLAASMNDALQQAEARFFMEADQRSAFASGSGNNNAAAAGGAGGGGGDDDNSDDDDNNDDEDGSSGYATAASRDEREQQDGNNNNAAGNGNNRNYNNNAREDGNDDNDAIEGDGDVAVGRGAGALRRSMRIRSAARNNRQAVGADRDAAVGDIPPPNYQPRRALLAAARRIEAANVNNNDFGGGVDLPFDGPKMLRRALEGMRRQVENNNLIDVSDDEDISFLPGPEPVFRLKRGKSDNETLLPSPGKRKKPDSHGNDKHKLRSHADGHNDDDDDGVSSDDESIDLDFLLSTTESNEPSMVLWESYPRHTDDGDGSDDDGDNSANGRVNIPISWLRSGFNLSKCGNGLAMSAPPDDDWDRSHRQSSAFPALRDGPLKSVKAIFPYNCKGVSALLSIVTALLYSGASIRGGKTVACDSDRVPFDELTLDQRKREFDQRLTDALSSLIFVAAQTGSQRYKEKLQAYERHWAHRCRKRRVSPEEEANYTMKRMLLQRRTRACNVCWWETDATNGNATIFPEGRIPRDVNIKVSSTNIHDIKSYVKTNLRSFKEPGGCALLLETILHCHGPNTSLYTTHSFSNGTTFGGAKALLNCKFDESLKALEARAKDKSGDFLISPEDMDCMTVELLSLILSGDVHYNYDGWSADIFGVGLLHMSTHSQNNLNPRLLRPIKPVWICLGELGYSTLFLNMNDLVGGSTSLDIPGNVLSLSHWDCWSGERLGFRVITSLHGSEPNQPSCQNQPVHIPTSSSESEEEGRSITTSISSRMHHELKRDAVMLCGNSPGIMSITDKELQSVKFHPEDEKYYPGQYRRWRFNFDGNGNTLTSFSPVNYGPEDSWIPFYRLQGRQRLIIEMKVAPKICNIVRTRWPMAIVRDFLPEGRFPLV